ncbi:ABC transporter substrate-binding protein [Glaciibacter superstes]|uniref:ABC transporter substrate-binding protein n=1 Tax=Glaciibacter superstes TaxID=501023 RepID=UPI0003B510A7|nr:sugar ABC transporter substrate-binding protein [Glaciibacter superstes]
MKIKRILTLAIGMAVVAPLAACSAGGSDAADGGGGTVQWWTWDDKQAVSYKKCIAPFEAANPDIKVEISQYAWDDYWTKITTGFVAGTAPDAFQNNVSYYPEYVDQGQLLALDDKIAETKFDLAAIGTGVGAWTYKDDSLYGIPMDWATVGHFYNETYLADAGLTTDDIDTMTWNPKDGGTFDKVVARLTVDANGVRGDEAGFDKSKVAVYGAGSIGTNGLNGQDSWAGFLSTTGWTLGNDANWPTSFEYEAPEFVAAMNYFKSLSDRGFTPREGDFTQGAVEQLGSGKVAMVVGGSWYAPSFNALPGIEVGIAPSVLGDNGKRSGLTNSNANSIWKNGPRIDNAWEWVSFMGSEECQSIAGADGTFFPSIEASMAITEAAMLEQGIDLAPYTAQFADGSLFTTPMFSHGQELGSTIQPMFQGFFNGERGDDVFAEMSEASRQILAD